MVAKCRQIRFTTGLPVVARMSANMRAVSPAASASGTAGTGSDIRILGSVSSRRPQDRRSQCRPAPGPFHPSRRRPTLATAERELSMAQTLRIVFVWVGLMGHGMARNLLEKGFPVAVLGTRNRTPVEALKAAGAAGEGSSTQDEGAGEEWGRP